MPSIFNHSDNEIFISRINNLSENSKAQWGKMSVDQMLSHCIAPIDLAFGMTPTRSNFVMKLVGKMLKGKILNSDEFKKNSPTAPGFIRSENYDLESTKNELIQKIRIFAELGEKAIKVENHPFFGKLTYDEWSKLQTMHLNHHLQQFGV